MTVSPIMDKMDLYEYKWLKETKILRLLDR